MTMPAQVALVLATLLSSLVAGFLFAFAVVVMPGIGRLADREFLRAFQEIDGVIQRGAPRFGIVWLGSILATVAGLVLGWMELQGLDRVLLALAGGGYLLGVQLPTFLVNVPLNGRLQAVQLDGADHERCRLARMAFEPRWNRWNNFRTAVAVLTAGLFVILLLRT